MFLMLSAILPTGYTHGVFTYKDVEKAIQHHPWKPSGPVVSTHFVHRLIKARSVMGRAGVASTNCAVYQMGEGAVNIYLIEYDKDMHIANVRACLYHDGINDRHIALKDLRGWFLATLGGKWKLIFDADSTAESFEWAWGSDDSL